MAGIFISYRRADSDGWAGRLRDALRVRFGDLVFQDVDNIPDGEIFADVIDRALQECDVALVIIGPNWASAEDENGRRRLDQEDDWVRTETAMVLNRKIRVIPVLVGGARVPRAEDLPEELRSLTKRQAREIRSTSWDSDVALLTHHLKEIVQPARRRAAARRSALAAAVLLAAGVVAGGVYIWQGAPAPVAEREAAATAAPQPATDREELSAKSATEARTGTRAGVDEAAATPAARPEPPPKPAAVAQAAKDRPREPSKPPFPTASGPIASKPPEPPRPAALEPARPVAAIPDAKPPRTSPPTSHKAETVATAKPVERAAAPERESVRPERRELARGVTETTPVTAESRKSVAIAEEPPAERTPSPAAQKPAAPPVARATATLNLPNRPASARELKIGDSWTYRLREARFDRELATVTHEVGGGDPTGIRETVRLVTKSAAAEADAAGGHARAAQRRLALEPRIFEQPLAQGAMLFEFAPFMLAFSDLQPGVKWSKIPGASSSDSISDWRFAGRVTGRERVRVPAGTFDAIKAELEGQLDISFPSTRDPFSEMAASYQTYSIWFVPEIGRAVKYDRRTFNRGRRLLEHEEYELVRYQLK
jgi:hypothetical protein